MKISFESWIQEQEISEDAELLFEEAIKCYRIGAYRASFLMSYLGFMKTLRDRLMKSEKPTLVSEKDWEKKKQKLMDDSKWEEVTYVTTQEREREKSKIYFINIDLMEEIPYWRKKRNEVAHAKDSIVGYSHVETFWLFLQSNMSKFVVNGGKESLLRKIERHFDKKYTEPGTDLQYLIDEIPLVVKNHEIPMLLKEIRDNYVDLKYRKTRQEYLFWDSIAHSPNDNLSRSFIEYISSDDEVFAEFMQAFPDKLIFCIENKELVRHFWMETLFKNIGPYSSSFWELSLTLLRNECIPNSEIPLFIRRLSANVGAASLPNKTQSILLSEYGFFEAIKESVFESGILNQAYSGYQAANSNATKIIYYLNNNPLDKVVVEQLNRLFKSYSYGQLHDLMKEFIQKNPSFLLEFNLIAESNGLSVAEFFEILDEDDIND